MAISVQILGQRGGDSGALITVNTGQKVSYLLFDCGEDTVSRLPLWETAQIDHVLFSHFHMDHVAGFDSFFRRHFDRDDRVNHIWGPPGTSEVMGHRFKGFVWNLVEDRTATWVWSASPRVTSRSRTARRGCSSMRMVTVWKPSR
jgi:ribonuclease Z